MEPFLCGSSSPSSLSSPSTILAREMILSVEWSMPNYSAGPHQWQTCTVHVHTCRVFMFSFFVLFLTELQWAHWRGNPRLCCYCVRGNYFTFDAKGLHWSLSLFISHEAQKHVSCGVKDFLFVSPCLHMQISRWSCSVHLLNDQVNCDSVSMPLSVMQPWYLYILHS